MIKFEETKSNYRLPAGFLFAACIIMMALISLIRNSQPVFDYPEEFNVHTISKDRANPTEMIVVYDTLNNKYVFEFIDK